MFEVQVKAWSAKLEHMDADDPERERVEAHIERLRAHDELAKLSYRETSFPASSKAGAFGNGRRSSRGRTHHPRARG